VQIGIEIGSGGRGLGRGLAVGERWESEVGRFVVLVAKKRIVKVVVRGLLLVLIGI
jgi:hypothetical protein